MLTRFFYAAAATAITLSVSPLMAMGESDNSEKKEIRFTTNEDVWGGQWEQVKGKFKEKFGKLINDEAMVGRGNRQDIAGKLQEEYGWTKVEAEEKLDEFLREHKIKSK